MKIPKVIHYCWFGKGPIPEKERQCIETWKNYFPSYELKFWNEDNLDYQSCLFAKQAYENKKYAFVSDYARAKILYEYGGIYLDTDIKILKPFNEMFENAEGVVGFERKAFVGTAVIGCQPQDPCMKELLAYYETHNFIQKDGSVDNIANVSVLTDIMKERGLVLGGQRQTIQGYEVYNREYFYPKKISETEFRVTDETVAIHMCSNSWMTERERKRGNNKIWIEVVRPFLRGCRSLGMKLIGKESVRTIEIKLRNILK